MAEKIKIVAQERKARGSREARRVRRTGLLPGVLYDEKGQSRLIQLNRHDFELILHRHRSEALVVDLLIGDEPEMKALLREVQRHPVSGVPVHVDFWQVSMGRKMRVPVRVVLKGEPVGVQAGGILQQLIREIEIECLPQDLEETLAVDVSHLKLGDHILVKELPIPAKWQVLTAQDVVVAAVVAPRLEAEEVPAAEAEAAQPEVITEAERKKREEAAAQEEATKQAGAGESADRGKEKSK